MKKTFIDIFDKISELENHQFKIGEQYLNKTMFQIETPKGYKDVVSMLIKEDVAVTISTAVGDIFASNKHRIMTDDGLKFVKDLHVGDKLQNTIGLVEIQNINAGDVVTVYDITVDDEDHLFLDSNGFIHHNTWHITEGPRSLTKLLGPEGAKWTYHSGMKANPFTFYKTLFQERDKIIVFDEADSVLKHSDIIMMLKPILDTSGSNMAELAANWTQNMVGKDIEEIEDYSKEIDARLEDGEQIGVGKTDVKLPSKFQFTGGMIFISNMKSTEIEKAIMSRSIFVDVNLAQQDVLKRIKSIALHQFKDFGEDYVDDLMEGLGQSATGPDIDVQYMTPEFARKQKGFTVRAMQLAHILRQSGLTRWKDLASLYA